MNRQAGFLANISVNWKLNLIVAVMIIGLLGAFLSGIGGMQAIQSSLSISYDQVLNSNIATSQLSESFLIMQTNLDALLNPNLPLDDQHLHREAINTAKENALAILENYEADHLSSNNPLISSITQMSDLFNLQDQEEIAYLSLRRTFDQYLIADQQFQELFESGIRDEYFATVMNSRLADSQHRLSQLVEVNNKYTEAYREESISIYQDTVGFMTIALVFTIVVGWLIANAITRSIGRRLGNLEQSASLVEEQYTDLRFSFNVEGKDEIAKLGNTFNRMTKQLQNSLLQLENRVQERTSELEERTKQSQKRAAQLGAVAQVARNISTSQDLESLLPKITNVISQQFSFYHVGIFMLDADREFAVLRAANSPGGQKMLKRKHQLKVGETGIVGFVSSRGEARIALDTGADAVYFDNPDLPDTRSEMALPLSINNQVIGALDVQSVEPNAFSQEDVNTLSTLADQVSIAIQNARLYEETRGALAQSQALIQQFTQEGWSQFTRSQKLTGIRRSKANATLLKEPLVTDDLNGNGTLNLPINLRGQKIGMLKLHAPDEHQWTQDEIDIATSIIERAAIALENARLLDDAQRRATRERVIGDISASISTFSDMEGILRTAVQQLGRRMGGAEVVLELGADQESEETSK